MDNLLAYIILLAPGLIIMLINERVGSHPSAKYTNTEKLVMSVLFTLPVLIGNMLLLYLKTGIANVPQLQEEIKGLSGLILFTISSILFSIFFCYLWHGYIKENFVVELINKIRRDKDKCDLNEGNLVWEDAFHGRKGLAVRVILKDAKVYGSPTNMSENISDERCLLLADSEIVKDIVENHNVPVRETYVDTKSGVAVEIYDSEKFLAEYNKKHSQNAIYSD
ncbi:hypothetical protein Dred_2610 [Desulforamulus reducens MI-1]|uniref:Uncharacterized protein n=1 Tax=Desulforamulus reducens (strain ATCC BAA-1160 / DSM 100696 / MI-1) TaxID=349161 RepID=A4J7R7_DESRM|nr:DUF6338 family protein [Desulforamulus reducens]ABO51120.1 hypothetical protein Dred_2610 [Desulforamulus reducens MI-1]